MQALKLCVVSGECRVALSKLLLRPLDRSGYLLNAQTPASCGKRLVAGPAPGRLSLLRFGWQITSRQICIANSTRLYGKLLIQLKQLGRNLSIEELLRGETRVPVLA